MWKWLSPFSSATISSLVQRRSTRPNGRAFIPTRPAGRFSAIHIGWLWLPYVRWVAMVRILRLQVQHQKIRSPDLVNATRIAHKSLLDSPHRLAEPICALPKGGDPGSLKPLLTRLRLLSWLSLCHRSICLSSCKQAGQSTSCQTAPCAIVYNSVCTAALGSCAASNCRSRCWWPWPRKWSNAKGRVDHRGPDGRQWCAATSGLRRRK